MRRPLSHPESGFSLAVMAAIFLIMIVVITLAIESSLYLLQKSRLQIMASEVAAFGAGYLPNPILAHDQSYRYFQIYKKNLMSGGEQFQGAEIKVFFDSSAGDKAPYNGDPSAPETDQDLNLKLHLADGSALGWSGSDATRPIVELPVRAMTIRLISTHQLSFFRWSPIPEVTIAAEATVMHTPTDVVLVIENSNSLISPLEEELGGPIPVPTPVEFFGIPEWRKFQPYAHPYCKFLTEQAAATSSGLPPYITSFCPNSSLCPSFNSSLGNSLETQVMPGLCATTALRMMRQCFGRTAINIKRAAIMLHDLLSASGTYRVGVVHSMTQGGEQSAIAAPIGTHPVRRNCMTTNQRDFTPSPLFENRTNRNYYWPRDDSGALRQNDPSDPNDDDDFCGSNWDGWGIDVDPNAGAGNPGDGTPWPPNYHPVNIEQVYGLDAFPSTRCAAITQEAPFQVPLHPFAAYIADSGTGTTPDHYWFRRNLAGVEDDFMPPNGSGDGLNRLRYKSLVAGRFPLDGGDLLGPQLLPREVIWMKPSGYVYNHGLPIERYDLGSMQFGVLQAMQMLREAPPRPDGLAVRRKIVIVLTDGVDDLKSALIKLPLLVNTPILTLNNEAGAPITFSLANQDDDPQRVLDIADIHCMTPPSITAAGISSPFDIDILSAVSSGTPFNPKDPGIILGNLFYGYSGGNAFIVNGAKIDPFQNALPGHDFSKASVNGVLDNRLKSFRSACTTKWSNYRARFWAELSPYTKTAGSNFSVGDSLDQTTIDPSKYAADLAPLVAKALMITEESG